MCRSNADCFEELNVGGDLYPAVSSRFCSRVCYSGGCGSYGVERGELAPDERVVALITGNGLKDVASAQDAASRAKAPVPEPIPPSLDAVAQALSLR